MLRIHTRACYLILSLTLPVAYVQKKIIYTRKKTLGTRIMRTILPCIRYTVLCMHVNQCTLCAYTYCAGTLLIILPNNAHTELPYLNPYTRKQSSYHPNINYCPNLFASIFRSTYLRRLPCHRAWRNPPVKRLSRTRTHAHVYTTHLYNNYVITVYCVRARLEIDIYYFFFFFLPIYLLTTSIDPFTDHLHSCIHIYIFF
jgi:hypothetical protein